MPLSITAFFKFAEEIKATVWILYSALSFLHSQSRLMPPTLTGQEQLLWKVTARVGEYSRTEFVVYPLEMIL